MCGLFEWMRICAVVLLFAYICIGIEDPIFKRWGDWIPVAGLTSLHICSCPGEPGLIFPMSYILFCVRCVEVKCDVCVVDICEIFKSHCFKISLIIYFIWNLPRTILLNFSFLYIDLSRKCIIFCYVYCYLIQHDVIT